MTRRTSAPVLCSVAKPPTRIPILFGSGSVCPGPRARLQHENWRRGSGERFARCRLRGFSVGYRFPSGTRGPASSREAVTILASELNGTLRKRLPAVSGQDSPGPLPIKHRPSPMQPVSSTWPVMRASEHRALTFLESPIVLPRIVLPQFSSCHTRVRFFAVLRPKKEMPTRLHRQISILA